MYGAGSGTIAICGWVQQVRLITLRTRRTVLGRAVRLAGLYVRATLTRLSPLTLRYWPCLAAVSATWTAPPPIRAQPAAHAESFARAILTDIGVLSSRYPARGTKRTSAPSPSRLICHTERREFLTGQRR